MSIGDILNDINDGISGDIDQIDGVTETSLEEIKKVTVSSSDGRIHIGKLDSGVIDKFNTLYKRCLLRKAICGMTKVERSIAVEAMATLPLHSPTNEAKLTSVPSAINKKILDDIVFTGKDEVPGELHNYLLETFSLFNESFITGLNNFIDFIVSYSDSLRATVNAKIKTATVMVDGVSHNLLAESLFELIVIDDSSLFYDKYAGELNKRIRSILTNEFYAYYETLREITGKKDGSDLSVVGLLADLPLVEVILRGVHQSVTEFITVADYYVKRGNPELTGAAAEAVSALERVIPSTETYNKLSSVLNEESVFLKDLISYAEFID